MTATAWAQDTLVYLPEPHTDWVFAVEGFGWFELFALLLGLVLIGAVIRAAWKRRRNRRLVDDSAND